MKVHVVGCGVVGSFVAYELWKRGFDVKVTSLRKKVPHVGLIQSLMQKFDEDIEMAYRTRQIYYEVSRELELDNIFHKVQSYTVVLREREETLRHLIRKWREKGAQVKIREFRKGELPFEHDPEREIVAVCDNDLIVRIDKILNSIWRLIYVEECEAHLKVQDGMLQVVTKRSKDISDIVIIACGAYTKYVLEEVGIRLPLASYKCQAGVFMLSTNRADYILYDYVNRLYVRPILHVTARIVNSLSRKTKLMICGNGNTPPLDPRQEKRKIEPWFVNEMLSKLCRRFRTVKFLLGRADFCDTTPDSKPLIAVQDIGKTKLIVVSGLDGYGVEIGPALAKIVVKIVSGQKLDDFEVRYLASRFGKVQAEKLPEVEAHEL